MRASTPVMIVLIGGCVGTTPAPAPAPPAASPSPPKIEPSWAAETRSPWPAPSIEPREATLAAACGGADGALVRVATRLVADRARGLGAPDADRALALLRVNGEPHVRPRLVSASARGLLDAEELRARLAATAGPTTRCGVAFARTAEDKEMFVAIEVDALADLEALPTRARTGEWLTLRATLRVPANGAQVIVLGPRGLPRTVPTSLDRHGGIVHTRFALDRPGAFTVQLVGEIAGGPTPLLEARVFADVEPPSPEQSDPPAPGEGASAGADDVASVARMLDALRESESLPPLRRDERLDALARAHAEAMRRAGAIAHDLGDGDLAARFEAAGLAAKTVGENVARARSAPLAHRVLHASPSHRMNLLRAEYTHVGLGVVSDETGNVYVCQVFAAALR